MKHISHYVHIHRALYISFKFILYHITFKLNRYIQFTFEDMLCTVYSLLHQFCLILFFYPQNMLGTCSFPYEILMGKTAVLIELEHLWMGVWSADYKPISHPLLTNEAFNDETVRIGRTESAVFLIIFPTSEYLHMHCWLGK